MVFVVVLPVVPAVVTPLVVPAVWLGSGFVPVPAWLTYVVCIALLSSFAQAKNIAPQTMAIAEKVNIVFFIFQ